MGIAPQDGLCEVTTLMMFTEMQDPEWNGLLGRLRLSYASNSRNPRVTRVPIEQPQSIEHVTIFELD